MLFCFRTFIMDETMLFDIWTWTWSFTYIFDFQQRNEVCNPPYPGGPPPPQTNFCPGGGGVSYVTDSTHTDAPWVHTILQCSFSSLVAVANTRWKEHGLSVWYPFCPVPTTLFCLSVPLVLFNVRSSLKDWQSMKKECINARHNPSVVPCSLYTGNSDLWTLILNPLFF
jgi:hypothetical protein